MSELVLEVTYFNIHPPTCMGTIPHCSPYSLSVLRLAGMFGGLGWRQNR